MRDGLQDIWRYTRQRPLMALGTIAAVLMFVSLGVLALRTSMLIDDLHQETRDRIQLACDMSFANGQAILDTAARDREVPPETIELYRQNLKKYSNQAIQKFDPEFNCEIPEASNAPNGKGQEDSRQDEEDLRNQEGDVGLLRIG